VGPDGRNAIGMLSDLIEDEELYDELRTASYADADNDARPIVIAWMEQHADEPVYEKVLMKFNTKPESDTTMSSEKSPELPSLANDNTDANDQELPEPEQSQSNKQSTLPPLEEADHIRLLKRLSGLNRE